MIMRLRLHKMVTVQHGTHLDKHRHIFNNSIMRAPLFKGEGILCYEDIPDPVITNDDDVIVSPIACGICGTDLNIMAVPSAHSGKTDIVIGHEAVGIATQVGKAVTGVKEGDRVVIAPRITCGKCTYCLMGLNNQCTDYTTVGTTRNGAFAPRVLLPQRALYTISNTLPVDDALFFEPLSCAVGAIQRAPFMIGHAVLIIGGGPMGMLFALLYRAMGARIVWVADISEKRLAFCNTNAIAQTINVNNECAAEVIKRDAPLGADLVIDAVGNQIESALPCVRRAGHIILFGLRAHDRPRVSQYAITRHDITIHGVFVGLNPFIDTLNILESKLITPSVLITHHLPLEQLSEGVRLMRAAEAMKVKIDIQQ